VVTDDDVPVVFRSRRSIVSLTKSIASCWSTAFTSRNYGRRIEPVKSVFIRLYCYQQILTEDGNLMCTTLRSQHDNCKRVFQAVYCSKKLTVHYTTSLGVYGYLCVHKYAHITNEMQTKTLSRDSPCERPTNEMQAKTLSRDGRA
jgi:hypothetical protein